MLNELKSRCTNGGMTLDLGHPSFLPVPTTLSLSRPLFCLAFGLGQDRPSARRRRRRCRRRSEPHYCDAMPWQDASMGVGTDGRGRNIKSAAKRRSKVCRPPPLAAGPSALSAALAASSITVRRAITDSRNSRKRRPKACPTRSLTRSYLGLVLGVAPRLK